MREVIFGVLASVSVSGSTAFAQTKDECLSAYESAQVARKQGRLLVSRDALRTCADKACPKVTRDDCEPWLGEVEKSIPSVVVEGRCSGKPQAVRAAIDGSPLAADGTLDPGRHTLELTTDFGSTSQALDVKLGEKARSIVVDLPVNACPAAPARSRPLLPVSIAFGAVSVVSFGLFAGFGIAGITSRQDLIKRCYPACKPSEVSSVQTMFGVADTSMVVGIGTLVVAGVLFVIDWSSSKEAPRQARDSLPFTF